MNTSASRRLGWLGGLLLLPATVSAQTCDDINPNIQAAALQVQIATVGTAYRYQYTIVNPPSDTGCIRYSDLLLPSHVPVTDDQVIAGSGIPPNHKYSSRGGTFTPPGVYSVTAQPLCNGGVGGTGGFSYTCHYPFIPAGQPVIRGPRVYPGQSFLAMTIVSPWPPGPRSYKLQPDWQSDSPNTTLLPCQGCDLFANVQLIATTVGPTAPSELVFYDGGGQNAATNDFLRYTSPVQHETDLRASETRFPVGIAYGPTTIPSTFHAVLNGTDISSSFHPSPNHIEGVTISLQSGGNTLVLSIDGMTAAG